MKDLRLIGLVLAGVVLPLLASALLDWAWIEARLARQVMVYLLMAALCLLPIRMAFIAARNK